MNTFAIPALKEKRAQIAGRVLSLKKQIARHGKELASLDATIALFDPTYRVGSIKPKRAHHRSKLFRKGELGRLIQDALRRAEGRPLATKEIVTEVATAIGGTRAASPVLYHSVRSNLAYLSRRNVVEKIGDRAFTKWKLRG
jgi:hypothetical protein